MSGRSLELCEELKIIAHRGIRTALQTRDYVLVECEEPGLSEDDMAASVATLEAIATTLNAHCVLIRERMEHNGLVKEFLVRKEAEPDDFMEIR